MQGTMSKHPAVVFRRRALPLTFFYVVLLSTSGCAYFRWGDHSYSEIQRQTEEQKAADEMEFNPKAVIDKMQ
jgi:hypothetical protein